VPLKPSPSNGEHAKGGIEISRIGWISMIRRVVGRDAKQMRRHGVLLGLLLIGFRGAKHWSARAVSDIKS
jgi:hypothetical protein